MGWLECPLEFSQPLRDHRLLVCKTPIDNEIAEYFKIPKERRFEPHTIYSLPKEHRIPKTIGLVIDLTNMKWYDEIAFNHGRKTNKVKRRIIAMDDLQNPSEQDFNSFVGLVSAFLDGANNQDKWIVVHDDLGYNLAGFMCCAFMVKHLNYSVDAAVYQFSNSRKPGIFREGFIRTLHRFFSDSEDLEAFEQFLKLRPLAEPKWMPNAQKKGGPPKVPFIQRPGSNQRAASTANNLSVDAKNPEFAVPTTSITSSSRQNRKPGKRSFSEMNHQNGAQKESAGAASSLVQEPSLLSEPVIVREPEPMADSTPCDVIQEPTMFQPVEPTLLGPTEPPMKRPRVSEPAVEVHVPPDLKADHPYLVAVRGQHLQHLTQIVLQLSKTKELFHGITNRAVTVGKESLMGLKAKYRISWLGHGPRFWMMALGKMGAFFVDPSFFATGRLGGIYHIQGTQFHDVRKKRDLDGTLCCGELVVDRIVTDKQRGTTKKVPRFLITDLLVFDKQSLSKFPHSERMQRAENQLYRACAKSLQASQLRVRVKPMYNIESMDIVAKLKRMIERELPHKCDGLGLFPIAPPFGQRMLKITL